MTIPAWRLRLKESWEQLSDFLWPESPAENRQHNLEEVDRALTLQYQALKDLAQRGEKLRTRLAELDGKKSPRTLERVKQRLARCEQSYARKQRHVDQLKRLRAALLEDKR
jgi:hypothetical protein